MADQKEGVAQQIFLSPPWMGGCERERVAESFASNYIAPCGPMVDRFEREFGRTVGLPHACALSSCTAALDLLFHELHVSRGDTVFCSDLTFVASIAPAVHRGADPVFIDCDAATWTMNPDLLLEALGDAAKTGRLPKAVVAVDLYGQCGDYDRLEKICEHYGVPLIIDAAEALGALYLSSRMLKCGSAKLTGSAAANGANPTNTRAAGQAGWAAVYSFNGNKIITTSGGGMLASRNREVADRARWLSQQAREPYVWYEHRELGYNYRMSNIVASIGVGQLSYLDTIIAKKRSIFDSYSKGLATVEGLSFMPEAVYGRCTRWLTVIQFETESRKPKTGKQRLKNGEYKTADGRQGTEDGKPAEIVERVRLALAAENIESRPVWKPMHLQPVFQGAKIYGGTVSEYVFRGGLCLPSGAGLNDEEIGRVIKIIRTHVAKH